MQRLTSSQLNYLLCIQQLCAQNGKVRSADLSRAIGLSMPSVHNMLVTLCDLGVVRKEKSLLFLTEDGQECLQYYQTAAAAAGQLLRSIGICNDVDARLMTTMLSPETVDDMVAAYCKGGTVYDAHLAG